MNTNIQNNDIVIGAGFYQSQAKLKTLIVNEDSVGGYMVLTHEITNYQGVENNSGYHVANIMKKQAKTSECDIKPNFNIELLGKVKSLTLSNGNVYMYNSIIIISMVGHFCLSR